MNTQITCHAVLFAVLLVVGLLSPVQAEDRAPAFGQTNATLGCDKTPDGYRVSVLDQVFRNEFRAGGIDVALGDPCLPALAAFPPPFPRLLAAAQLNPSAAPATVKIPDCLIWILDGAEVANVVGFGTFVVRQRKVVACDADGSGGLVTTLVDTPEGPDLSQIGNRCGSTLGELTAQGMQSSVPITGVLGYNAMGAPAGGLSWVITGPDYIEVLECNKNAAEDQLVVTYRESYPGGVDTGAEGESCLASIAESEAAGRQLTSGPIPLPQGHDATDDRGCLLWIIDGGVYVGPNG